MLFIVINSIAVSGLRSDQGLAQSLASRYRTYSNLLLAFSYMYIIEDLLPLVKSVLCAARLPGRGGNRVNRVLRVERHGRRSVSRGKESNGQHPLRGSSGIHESTGAPGREDVCEPRPDPAVRRRNLRRRFAGFAGVRSAGGLHAAGPTMNALRLIPGKHTNELTLFGVSYSG